MVIRIIKPNSKLIGEGKLGADRTMDVSELYCDTIQGEGVYSGVPSVILRLSNCTLNCKFCDTVNEWTKKNYIKINDLLQLFYHHKLVERLKNGHHLILTGGSPLLQQNTLAEFIKRFIKRFNFKPFIEVENECTIMPNEDLIQYVDCWNNSPKLKNSGVKQERRYRPDVLITLKKLNNSWFKFVVKNKKDWDEIWEYYILRGLIKSNQVILMPEGKTRREIQRKAKMVVGLCCTYNMRFSNREHIEIWDSKKGV